MLRGIVILARRFSVHWLAMSTALFDQTLYSLYGDVLCPQDLRATRLFSGWIVAPANPSPTNHTNWFDSKTSKAKPAHTKPQMIWRS